MVFMLYYPLLDDGENLHFRDIANVKTIETCHHFNVACDVIARKRVVYRNPPWRKLSDTPARLRVALPDYGAAGRDRWFKLAGCFSPFLWRRIWKCIRGADLVYVEVPSLEAYLACWVARLLRRPLVMEMRAEMVLNAQYMRARFGWKGIVYVRLLDFLFRNVRRHAEGAIYINASCMRRYPIAQGAMAAICDAELPPALFERAVLKRGACRRWLYVGNLEIVKAVDVLLAALAEAGSRLGLGWELNVVGDGPDAERLKLLADRLGIDGNVVWHGRVPWGDELFRFYSECDALVLTSMTETGPRVVLEAMAAGMPVISTKVGLAEELLPSAALVDVGDQQMLAQKLIEYSSNADLVRRMAVGNFERIRAFAATDWAQRRTDFWREMIASATGDSFEGSGAAPVASPEARGRSASEQSPMDSAISAEYANLSRRCLNPWTALRAAGDGVLLVGRAVRRRHAGPLHFYPAEVLRLARQFAADAPRAVPQPPEPCPKSFGSGSLKLSIGRLPYDGEPNWTTSFTDNEEFESLHRWNWLLEPLAETHRPPSLWKWGIAIMGSWNRYNKGATTGERWGPYAMSERISNACLFHLLTRDGEDLPDDLVAALDQTARLLALRLEYFGPEATGNHVINEARGLLYAGHCLQLPAATALAETIVRAHLPILVTSDGFLREGSSHYQFIFTRWILEMHWLARQGGHISFEAFLAPTASKLVERCWFFLVAAGKENWQIPYIGDISPDFPPVWLVSLPWSGHALRLFKPRVMPSRPLARGWAEIWRDEQTGDSGTGVNRAGTDNEIAAWSFPSSFWHRIDCGPLVLFARAEQQGTGRHATHRHGDLGGFVLFYRGTPILVDCGRANYRTDDTFGMFGLSARAHNTLLVDGCESLAPVALARLPGFYRANNVSTRASREGDAFVLELVHDGFRRLARGDIQHTRRWIFRENALWLEDILEGEGAHRVETIFHFASELVVTISKDTGRTGVVWRAADSQGELVLDPAGNDDGVSVELRRAQEVPSPEGWCSRIYGEREPCTTLVVSHAVKLPWLQRYRIKAL